MTNGNGGDGAEVKTKMCPFLNSYCIKERCSLHSEMVRNVAGMAQKFTLCSFNAMVMMLSEINAKTQQGQPVQKIQVPKLFRG